MRLFTLIEIEPCSMRDNVSNKSSSFSRRSLLGSASGAFAGLALSDLLATENGQGKLQHHVPKAKRVVQLFMAGAASHVDTFDYKPLLDKRNGEPWDPGEKVELFQSTPGSCFASPWKFRPYGENGKWLSDIVAPLGDVVDKIAFVHNMKGKTGVHSQGTLLQTTGFNFPGFPSAGAWVSYALGSENENLPSFVVLPDHRGFASNGAKNWSTGFLPALHQGTVIQPGKDTPIADLFASADGTFSESSSRDGLRALEELNMIHAQQRVGDDRLLARIRSYELAAAMQLSATEALEIDSEPEHIHRMYGLSSSGSAADDSRINEKAESEFFGRKCLLARRLLERGVRFVQVWSGNDNGFPRRNWDSHDDLQRDHAPLARGMAKGAAALIKDLDQRGLLEDTLILWTTEFGRMPCSQGTKGRDHNPFVFTNWLCGGGVQGGTYGESDEWGYKPLDRQNVTEVYDIYATILHQLGLDHERLSVKNNGIDRRLTDVHGKVIREMIS